MTSRTVVIGNSTGFHARPAGLFVQTAARYHSTIRVRLGTRSADARTVLGLMLLGATAGSAITIDADGPDEAAAVDALAGLIQGQFGEAC
jgi:phosphocarrier protein HPr